MSIPALKSYTFFFTIRFPIKGNFGTCFQLRLMHQLIDAFTAEIQYAVDAIDWETEPTALSGVGARDALLLCYKEAEVHF